MNTTYEYIFSYFKDKITDPDLIAFSSGLQTEVLIAYMNRAIAKCNRIVKKIVDLSLRDDDEEEFTIEIPDEIVDIVTEWMTVFWLQPYVNNADNLRNHLSTADFKLACSPANLIEKISDRYQTAQKYARNIMNEYSFIIADMKDLKQ